MKGINHDLSEFLAPNLMDAGRRIDLVWNSGRHDPNLLYEATRMLVFLDLQSMDRLEIGDALPAKALAMLSITRAMTEKKCRDEEALLSFNMGYSNHAVHIAATLPQSDPARAYVNQDGQRLSELAAAQKSGVESHYLLLLNISETSQKTNDVGPFVNCLQTYFSHSWITLPVFKAGLDMHAFSLTPDMARTMPSMVLMTLERDEGAVPDPTDYLKKEMTRPDENFGFVMETFFGDIQSKFPIIINDFTSGLGKMDARYTGPFFDPGTYDAYYKGYFYSGLYDLGLHYLDALSSSDAAAHFAGVLGTAMSGTAADFRTWYTNLERSEEGKSSLKALSTQLDKSRDLGAAPFMRTFEEQEKYYRLADPALLRGARDIVRHLDTRIEDRGFLCDLAYSKMLDLKLAEKMAVSILAAASSTNMYTQLWYAKLSGNLQKITAVLNSPGDVDTKVHALRFLQLQKEANGDLISKGYQAVIQDAPDNWSASWYYADYLKKGKQYPEAINVLRDWLRRRVKTLGLEALSAHARIAKLYYEEKQYRKGWAEIKPYIESEKGDVMDIGALLLDKLGRRKDAEKLALFLTNRYPDDLSSRMPLLELYWRHGKYGKAADLLKASVHKLNTGQWAWTVGPAFAKIFKNKPKEAIAAFVQLRSRGFDPVDLSGVVGAVSKAGNNELAFNMYSYLRSRNALENLEYLVEAYKVLKTYKPKEEAVAWLRSEVPPQLYNPLSTISYDTNAFDLLWAFDPVPGNRDEVDWFWITRAAASLIKPLNVEQKQAIVRYFSSHRKGDCAIGRYLIGMGKKQDVFALMTGVKARCEEAYYLGLKAWKEGHYGDASDWFRVSLEIGRWQTAEYRWAYDALSNWYGKGETLERLSKDKL